MNVYFALVFTIIGFIILWKGADWLVDGASGFAYLARLSPIIIGITIVAFGTSLPEFAVSIAASIKGQPDLTIGNVVGSNIANILLVLGVAALLQPMKLARRVVTRESVLVVAIGVLLFVLALGGELTRVHGVILLAAFVAYMVYQFRRARKEHDQFAEELEEGDPHANEMEKKAKETNPYKAALLLIAGIFLVLVGSDVLVDSGVYIAKELGVSPMVIGLSLIAVGTSLPELATSAVAARKGESDISVGNVLGSNVFNTLLVLGLAATFITGSLAVADEIIVDIVIMTVVSLALIPTLFTDLRLTRAEGALMLVLYFVYIAYLAMRQGVL